jgi:hypothetical protein
MDEYVGDEFRGDGYCGRRAGSRGRSLALRDAHDPWARSDLLFLEAWEMRRTPDLAATLRAGQIRRANPGLAAAIERELKATNNGTVAARLSVTAIDWSRGH